MKVYITVIIAAIVVVVAALASAVAAALIALQPGSSRVEPEGEHNKVERRAHNQHNRPENLGKPSAKASLGLRALLTVLAAATTTSRRNELQYRRR